MLEYLADLSPLRSKNVMLPGKTYARRGAFVRKRTKSTPKRIATEDNDEEDLSDDEVEEKAKEGIRRASQPSGAAVEAARRAAKKTAEARSPSIPFDPSSVRDRVRHWQSQGGGVVTGPNIVVEFEDSENEAEFGGTVWSQPASPIKDRWGVRKETVAEKQQAAKKSRSPTKETADDTGRRRDPNTPRKRIISDEHWKQKPAPSKGNKDVEDSKRRLYNDGIRVTPMKDDEPKSRETKSDKKTFLDDGIRVYATPPMSRRTSAQNDASEDELGSDDGVRTSLPSQASETNSTNGEDLTPKTVHLAEPEIPVVARKDTKRTARGIFGAVFGESKRMFSRTETVYVDQQPENPRIDNWLGEIPDLPDDPFINDEKEREEPDIAKSPLHQKRKSKVTAPDPNSIWDIVSTVDTVPDSAEDLKRRQRRRRTSKPLHENSNSADEFVRNQGKHDAKDSKVEGSKSLGSRNHQGYPSSAEGNATGSKPRRNTLGVAALQALFSGGKEQPVENFKDEPPLQSSRMTTQPTAAGSSPRRPFPSVGGHRLSTIASVDTLNTVARSMASSEISADSNYTAKPRNRGIQSSDSGDKTLADCPRRKKTRLARHSDLMSVLSVSHHGGRSIRSARSVRTQRTRLDTATIPELLKELTDHEPLYMQELRTLVDGVIPVILSSILSRTESKAIASLFSPLGQSSFVSDAVYSMGVALEGLKKWHKRLEPSTSGSVSVTVFLTWAQGVQRIYQDYLKAWRMGFQDVVVNLKPVSDTQSKDDTFKQGLPRNKDGDVTNTDGERVDVAFLLKRPLTRLKDISRTLKGINIIQPSTLADKLAAGFQDLVVQSRRRVYEEKARLEDEAAANVDATRARRIVDLTLQINVAVNTARRVRARDFFDLSLFHTNGQRIECGVELFLRDDAPGTGKGADLLICQMDASGKWLLFPPVDTVNISARNGDSLGEIVVMLRGIDEHGRDWQELLSLTTDDEQTGFEWVQMLGLVPVPPQMKRVSSFQRKDKADKEPTSSTFSDSVVSASLTSSTSYTQTSRSLSSIKTQIPLGEHAKNTTKPGVSPASSATNSRSTSPSKHDSSSATTRASMRATCMSVSTDEEYANSSPNRAVSANTTQLPRSLNEAMRMAGGANSTLKRHRATKRRPESVSLQSSPQASSNEESSDRPALTHRIQSSPIRSSLPTVDQEQTPTKPVIPVSGRTNTSTPNKELPTIPKLRPASPSKEANPTSDKAHVSRTEGSGGGQQDGSDEEVPPPPPPHRASSPIKLSTVPVIEVDPGTTKGKRLSSSPLKYQYQPSIASDDGSETSSAAGGEDASDDDSSSSDDEDSFEIDDVPALPQQFLHPVRAPTSQPSLPSKTLGPSSSASQAPYKTVPSQPNKALHIAALVSYWSDKSQWVQLHSDVCSIVVAPGLVEIYQMYASSENNHVQPVAPSPSAQPLLVLHLTPMVLLQQGTALDVTVRSPPQGGTMHGTFTSVNFLFRSRSPEEAETLYGVFHTSRMNNPTYIALQQARATAEKPAFDSVFGGGQSRSTSSWFSFGRQKSYRASSEPTPKAKSDPSVGTRTTSFSAKLFGSGRFNIARSSVMSRKSPDGSIFTSSDNSLGSGTSSPLPGAIAGSNEAPLGPSNTKIRLYSREGNRWLDLGSATLTITRPTGNANDLNSPPEIGYAHGVGSNGVITPTQKRGADDKRIVVMKAKKGTILLDVTLGESCFERTARTGIALSLWEIFEGGTVADKGGVTNGRFKYFMMQFQNEAACAFTFSMVGRHRF